MTQSQVFMSLSSGSFTLQPGGGLFWMSVSSCTAVSSVSGTIMQLAYTFMTRLLPAMMAVLSSDCLWRGFDD